MRINKKEIKENKISFTPENLTDLFILSNLIEPNDKAFAHTKRRVRINDKDGRREGDKGERIKVFLGLTITNVELQDSQVDQRLRVRGKIIFGPENVVSLNSSHTFNIKENTSIIVQKLKWKDIHFKLINDAETSSIKPSIGVVALEKGYVSIGIINNYKIVNLFQERQIPASKLTNKKNRIKSDTTFFKMVLTFIKNNFSSNINHILIGGPGSFKLKFMEYLKEEWQNNQKTILVEDLSSGAELQEILNKDSINRIAGNYQVIEELKIINEFETLLIKNMEKICYGIEHSLQAAQQGAIESFLIINSYITQKKEELVQKIDELLNLMTKTKAKLLIVDSKSDNGKIISKFGGMIGLLRYALFID